MSTETGLFELIIDIHAFGAGDAGFTHAPSHHGGVGGLAAPAGEDALGYKEAVNIFRLGFDPG